MRLATVAFALACAASPALWPAAALAQPSSLRVDAPDSVARVAPRHPMRGSDALVSRDGRTALLLTEQTLILQFTEAGLAHVERETRRAERETGEGAGARLVAGLVGGVVRSMLDRAIEYDLRDLGEARWADGRLLLRRHSGEEVFGKVQVNDTDLMEQFEPREARAFAERVRRTAERTRRSAAR